MLWGTPGVKRKGLGGRAATLAFLNHAARCGSG